MIIGGTTRLTGVIGFPIEHSLSPAIHNKAFEMLNLDCVYVPIRVEPGKIGQLLNGIKAMNFAGINVTIPHKQAVMPYLDHIDQEARLVGAVNTIKNVNGKLYGYTTDTGGYIQSLAEKGITLKGKKVLVLGGGGAARSLAVGLALRKIPLCLTILGRTVGKVKKIIRDIQSNTHLPIRGGRLTDTALGEELEQNDLVINCTAVGMHPKKDATPIPRAFLRKGLIVSDIIYNPLETRLLREAKKAGCITIDGLGMLLFQGMAAFEIWTGKRPPMGPLRKEAMKYLRRH
jgi:shikimate dehydrogenase